MVTASLSFYNFIQRECVNSHGMSRFDINYSSNWKMGLDMTLYCCFLLFLFNLRGLWKYIKLPFPGGVGGELALALIFLPPIRPITVLGHRVKMEDSQKMQFSDRLSEIERYQRSMRMGPVNNNRSIHQSHLGNAQGKDRWCIRRRSGRAWIPD